MTEQRKHVVIVGAGFAGLYAAKALGRSDYRVTIIDKRNFHLFQPLLYQVASGTLSPADIATPLRSVLKPYRNVHVLQASVSGIDPATKRITYATDQTRGELAYDTLIVATGVKHHYFGNEQWQQDAPGLKTVEHALEMRQRILSAFEEAEWEQDATRRRQLLTFVVVGAGPTGVELAGTIAELAHKTLKNEFRSIDPADARILLIEGANQVLPSYPDSLCAKAQRSLETLGAEIHTNSFVTAIDEHGVHIKQGEQDTQIAAKTVLWAAGVRASKFGAALANATGCTLDNAGKVHVNADLSLPDHPDIFVIGDLAHYEQQGKPLPGVAPVAKQQGQYLAKLLKARSQQKIAPMFEYKDRGSLAVIGNNAAVADFGKLKLSGFWAWWVWAVAHIFFLIATDQKILVATRWFSKYFWRRRGVRLITGHAFLKRQKAMMNPEQTTPKN